MNWMLEAFFENMGPVALLAIIGVLGTMCMVNVDRPLVNYDGLPAMSATDCVSAATAKISLASHKNHHRRYKLQSQHTMA